MTRTTHEWLTADEVATELKVRRALVNAMAARGDLPGVKLGRVWRFRRDLFDDYLERRINPDPGIRSPQAEAARRRRAVDPMAMSPASASRRRRW